MNSRPALIPFPQQFDAKPGQFVLQNATVLFNQSNAPNLEKITQEWQRICQTVGILNTKNTTNCLQIQIESQISHTKFGPDGYRIEIQSDQLIVKAADPKGIFYAIQTLRQLFIPNQSQVIIPCCLIEDWPAYPIRGVMHDVGRNFQELSVLKQQLDLFAQYKLNVFHWHLTEDPAWRIECKCFPKLNSPKITPPTRDPGRFYTYAEIRDLIQYAKARNILVIPEIDMPGHSKAFRNGIGTSMNSFRGMRALKQILQEFFNEIPYEDAPYLHIGSDEVHLWNPKMFIKFVANIVQANHRQIIMWNPGLQPPKEAIVQNWGAPKMNTTLSNPYVDSKDLYINCNDLFQFIPGIFFHNLSYPKTSSSPPENGGILCHWPDVAVADKLNIYRHNPVHPAMLTFAERFWNGCHSTDPKFQYLFPLKNTTEYSKMVEFEARLVEHRDKYFINQPFYYLRQSCQEWQIIGPFEHKGKPTSIFPPEIKIETEYEVQGKKYQWQPAIGSTLCFRMYSGAGGFFPKAESSTAYALTFIQSSKDQKVSFWIGFEYKATSNRRYRGIPKQNQWDANGGQLWINDKPLEPPQWQNPGKYNHWWANTWHTQTQEIPYIDEEFYWTRPPTLVPLKQGWNKLLVKIPNTYKAQNWCFSCTPVFFKDSKGNPTEYPDLVFSGKNPEKME